MGLKGYRLWVMGQLDSNVQRPTAKTICEPPTNPRASVTRRFCPPEIPRTRSSPMYESAT
jgi:hypothetical protein